jgi:cytochrome c-type biogenesis protein CcmE
VNPRRKRKVRLIVSLCAVVVLASALAYTTFHASSAARTPSQLAGGATPGRSYQLSGKVVAGSVHHPGGALAFRVRDRNARASVPVLYRGAVPEPFREGREVIVTVRKRGRLFLGEPDSLVTKCPSKFTAAKRS